MSVKLLIEHDLELLSLKGGCTCSSESTLVETPHCWKSYVTDQWASLEKICLWGFANNNGADQTAHLRSLISAFVTRFLESFISRLVTSEISIF